MREARERRAFKRDLRRELSGRYREILRPVGEFWIVVATIANDIPLPERYRDHALQGDYEGSRECHIRPDLLLMYTLEGDDLLRLERLGSHAELFGM